MKEKNCGCSINAHLDKNNLAQIGDLTRVQQSSIADGLNALEIFVCKYEPVRHGTRHNAKTGVRGDQDSTIYPQEMIYSQEVAQDIVRLMLSLVGKYNYFIKHCEIKTAFFRERKSNRFAYSCLRDI